MSEPTKNYGHEVIGATDGTAPRDLLIYVVLVVCTLVSVGSSYLSLGPANGIIVLLIALFQALLTLWFFMEVRSSSRVLQLAIFAGIFTLGVLFVMCLTDYVSRAWGSW
jgi:cytochrome c oxidase subunit 4